MTVRKAYQIDMDGISKAVHVELHNTLFTENPDRIVLVKNEQDIIDAKNTDDKVGILHQSDWDKGLILI